MVSTSACSYDSDPSFGGDDDASGGLPLPGSSGALPGGGSSGGRGPGDPPPASCTDGEKSGDESDVDCGGSCDRRCDVGMACNLPIDCTEGSCQGGACQPPSGDDGVKNGDESDVDCGGTTTGAAACETGRACVRHADCASNGCKADATCADAPSCVTHFGGDTCGSGEVGSGTEQHESCCTSEAFDGYGDPNHPGQTVLIDRYEITAGRVREFIRRLAEDNGGQPNVRGWIQAHRPAYWNDAWTDLLPADNEGVYAAFTAYGEDNQGFHIHAMNCHHMPGTYGHATYWLPDDVMATYAGGQPRAYSQDVLDTKAMTCITHVMVAAFCAWDGGQMVTTEALGALTSNGTALPALPAGTIQIYRDGGNAYQEPLAYEYPNAGNDSDSSGRIVPPGRLAADVFQRGNGTWFDLAGNLNEMAMTQGGFSLMNDGQQGQASHFLGIGYYSATVSLGGNIDNGGIDNTQAILRPHYKSGLSGSRCMRFR